ncbi:MAG: Uma2 family endonuclease [Gemmatimonadaceae bacterium]|nr:Uma2 family endonuclease [Gemmatimonadaceae bacterium]
MPAHDLGFHTVDDVLAIPSDGQRYELVYGRLLVSPAPTLQHERIVRKLAMALHVFCDRHGLGEAFGVIADLTWGRRDVLVQPDIFVMGAADRHARGWEEVRHVPLVAEILSPATRTYDRFDKRRVYQDRNVALYWVIDPRSRTAEIWTPEAEAPVVERERLVWAPAGVGEVFSMELNELFVSIESQLGL